MNNSEDKSEKLIESAQEACMLIIGAYEGHCWEGEESLERTAEKMFKYATAGYAASLNQSERINQLKEQIDKHAIGFGKWYSGIDLDKVEVAYKRFIKESGIIFYDKK